MEKNIVSKFIVVKDNIIVATWFTTEGVNCVIKAIKKMGLAYDYISASGSELYAKTDEDGYFIANVPPARGSIYAPVPEAQSGKIQRFTGEWIYEDDIRGLYYHKENKSTLNVTTFKTDEDLSNYTRLVPGGWDKWEDDKWVFDHVSYRNNTVLTLRARCREEREKYFPEDVKNNLVVGQEYGNKLLTVGNYNKLVSFYRKIVAEYEPMILDSTTREAIDNIYNSIEWPDEESIIEMLG